jgi:hypothetical protein
MVKRMEVYCIYTYKDSILNPTKHCLKRGEKGGKNWDIMVAGNLTKVHCMHV